MDLQGSTLLIPAKSNLAELFSSVLALDSAADSEAEILRGSPTGLRLNYRSAVNPQARREWGVLDLRWRRLLLPLRMARPDCPVVNIFG